MTVLEGRTLRLHTLQRYATWTTTVENEGPGWRGGVAPVARVCAVNEGPVAELELGYRAATFLLASPPRREECPGCHTHGVLPDGRGLLRICPVCNGRGWA